MDVEQRLAALEKRTRAAEDQLEIIRLLASYAPAVDSGASDAAAALWREDGVYDVGGLTRAVGRAGIAARVDLNQDLAARDRGYGHLLTTPQITLDGDAAQAVNYSFAFTRRGDSRWEIERACANHWTLTRTAEGWRVVERFNRLIDGSQDARDTLGKAVGV
jgi:hypothetical protein